jgi:hypothetical protein
MGHGRRVYCAWGWRHGLYLRARQCAVAFSIDNIWVCAEPGGSRAACGTRHRDGAESVLAAVRRPSEKCDHAVDDDAEPGLD